MKKALTILLCLAMLLALCACGSKKEEETASMLGHLQHEGRETRYQNPELGVTCVLHAANWNVLSEEGLAQESGLTTQGKTAEEYAAELAQTDSYYDLYAVREDKNVFVVISLVKLEEDPDGFITEAVFADLAVQGLENALRSGGRTNIRSERNTVLFAGVEREGIFCCAEDEGTMLFCQVLFVKAGDRMAMVYLTSYRNDETKALASFFKPLI